MDRVQRGFFRQAAENKYLKLKRQEFQAWVGEILGNSLAGDYENIRLTQGDGGLDGIILSRSAVVAVNAPREQSAASLETKILDDYVKGKKTLADRGVELKVFIFIHNDEGLTKDTGPALMNLRQKEGIEVECWTFERIWKELQGLGLEELEAMFGQGLSTANVDQLQMPHIREVIEYLTKLGQEPPPLGDLVIPDPAKLEFNKLSEENQDMLRVGRTKHGLVEQFIEGMTDIAAGEAIAEAFRIKYAAVKESGENADDIFHVLWDFAGGNHFSTPPQFAAVTAILSYYFHSCDIFENVPKPS